MIPVDFEFWVVLFCLSFSITACTMGSNIPVVAVLLNHIDRKEVMAMNPNINLEIILRLVFLHVSS